MDGYREALLKFIEHDPWARAALVDCWTWRKPAGPPRAQLVSTMDAWGEMREMAPDIVAEARTPGYLYTYEPLTPNTTRITVWKADQ